MEILWPQSDSYSFYTGVQPYVVRSYPTIYVYRPFKDGCTSVHQKHMIRITTKRIETVNWNFVTSIPIRTASIQAYSHSSKLSHNTYVQTIWNWLYVHTSTVQDANCSQIDQSSGWDICDINSNSYNRCTGVQTWLNALPYKMNGPIHS